MNAAVKDIRLRFDSHGFVESDVTKVASIVNVEPVLEAAARQHISLTRVFTDDLHPRAADLGALEQHASDVAATLITPSIFGISELDLLLLKRGTDYFPFERDVNSLYQIIQMKDYEKLKVFVYKPDNHNRGVVNKLINTQGNLLIKLCVTLKAWMCLAIIMDVLYFIAKKGDRAMYGDLVDELKSKNYEINDAIVAAFKINQTSVAAEIKKPVDQRFYYL